MATLPKVLINQADSKSAGGVALRVRTQAAEGEGGPSTYLRVDNWRDKPGELEHAFPGGAGRARPGGLQMSDTSRNTLSPTELPQAAGEEVDSLGHRVPGLAGAPRGDPVGPPGPAGQDPAAAAGRGRQHNRRHSRVDPISAVWEINRCPHMGFRSIAAASKTAS